jgi:homoserine O-acetyltransferase
MVKTQFFHSQEILQLESKELLEGFTIAYQTYGTYTGDNAILICHALSGDAHAGFENEDKKKGWWYDAIGPEKMIDTNQFFVICSNVIGSCKGSTGPSEVNVKTGFAFGKTFPVITIADMVKAQERLISFLNISQLHAVIGGSMGGMQALEWSILYPDRVKHCVAIATAAQLSSQSLAFGAIGRFAIFSDQDVPPRRGLSLARMIGHVTYLSEKAMNTKFGRKLQNEEDYQYAVTPEFQIESYLQHQGEKFSKYFDSDSYVYLSKAMSYFDLSKKYGSLEIAFESVKSKFLILSISSDWIYPEKYSKEISKALMRLNKDVTYAQIGSEYGHDSFLIDIKQFYPIVKPFLQKR